MVTATKIDKTHLHAALAGLKVVQDDLQNAASEITQDHDLLPDGGPLGIIISTALVQVTLLINTTQRAIKL